MLLVRARCDRACFACDDTAVRLSVDSGVRVQFGSDHKLCVGGAGGFPPGAFRAVDYIKCGTVCRL